MALIPKDRYPGQIDESDLVGYPQGAAQNITSPGDGTGTPWEKDLVNDVLGFQQALLAQASIAPSGDADKVGASQYLQAVQAVAQQAVTPHFNANGEVVLLPAQTYRVFIPAGKAVDPSGTWPVSNQCSRQGNGNWQFLEFDLSPGTVLPRDAFITHIYALVDPGDERTGINRMQLEVGYYDFGIAGSPSFGPFAVWRSSYGDDDPQAEFFQWLHLDLSGGLDLMSLATYDVVTARVTSGADAAVSPDICRGLYVEYTCGVIKAGNG